jgi:hypothetical protein
MADMANRADRVEPTGDHSSDCMQKIVLKQIEISSWELRWTRVVTLIIFGL